jgi:small-conductance mechanosensitive channel
MLVVIRYAIVLLGSVATILITLQLFGIAVTQLLVGGAFGTVLVGIATQQSLSNLFAAMVLLLARPVDIGDRALIRTGHWAATFAGTSPRSASPPLVQPNQHRPAANH